jgi:predicted dehydrogenase
MINWAVIGTGYMAKKFILATNSFPSQKITAVYSRSSVDNLEIRALVNDVIITNEFNSIISDPKINAVYIATPLKYHFYYLKNSLIHQKSVICEKPLLENFDQYLEIYSIVKKNNLLLLEGDWTQYLDLIKLVKTILNSNSIGDITSLSSEFNRLFDLNRKNRILDKELGGGTFNEMSIYGISNSLGLFGKPTELKPNLYDFYNGIDLNSTITMKYNNFLAEIRCSFTNSSPSFTKINGSRGSIAWNDILKGSNYIMVENFEQNTTKKVYFENQYQYKMLEFFENNYYAMNHDFNLNAFSKIFEIGEIMCTIRDQYSLK